MIGTLISAAALAVALLGGSPSTEAPVSAPNKWEDSGHHAVWKGTPQWIRDFGRCVRLHESRNAGHYKAQNKSGASGAYQFMPSTWDGNARYTKVDGELVALEYVGKPARLAPPWIQDAVFIHSVSRGGMKNWNGTSCGYGT
jgi:hypothetical protein